MQDLQKFRNDLIGVGDEGADGTPFGSARPSGFRERAFSERICDLLVAAEVVDDLVPCTWRGKGTAGRLLGVDAASVQSPDGFATLMLAIFNGEAGDAGTVSQTEISKHALRLRNFAEEALAGGLAGKLPDNSPEEDLRKVLSDRQGSWTKLRLLIVTDLRLSERVKELAGESVAGIQCEYQIWDIERLAELSEKGHEPLEIDFECDFERGVACLPAHLEAAEYQSYLCVVPASLLADLYGKYGARLLETNVRGFLSERGKVNRGIRATIQNHPQMFFAYNNGLTATASSVALNDDESQILRVNDLQIVNGGQTTASLFWARKKHRADLRSVNVQMKLSVIPPSMEDRFDEIVSKISEYANSQNKVSDADLFANHGFHREMEKISRRSGAAPEGGGNFQTYWFYERARAQYDNERRALSKSDQKKFDQKFPKTQLLSKTDLAKYWACLEQFPQFVSRGAQKNFQKFAGAITAKWERHADSFNEVFYKRIIGVGILYKALEARIQREPWYDGYRINIIAYTLASLIRAAEAEGKRINLMAVWTAQKISPQVESDLVALAERVYVSLRDCPIRSTKPQWGNLGQWFKEDKCWEFACGVRADITPAIRAMLVSRDTEVAQDSVGLKGHKIDGGIDAQMEVVRLHAAGYWQRLRDWNQEDPVLSELEQEAVTRIARAAPSVVPRESECLILINAKRHGESEGFS